MSVVVFMIMTSMFAGMALFAMIVNMGRFKESNSICDGETCEQKPA